MNNTTRPSTFQIIGRGYLLVNIPTMVIFFTVLLGLGITVNINYFISIFIGALAGWYYWSYSVRKWIKWAYSNGIDRDRIIKIGRLSLLLWYKSTVDKALTGESNKIFKPFISTLLAFVIIVAGISIFKGPYFIFVKYYYYEGHAKQKSNNLRGAIESYTTVLTYDKNHITTYISRGSAYLDLKKYNEAISDYSEAIKRGPGDPRPYAYRGRVYYELADTTKSLSDYNEAIRLDNKFGYAYMNRGLLKYVLLNDVQGGCADLKIALNLGMKEARELLDSGDCE